MTSQARAGARAGVWAGTGMLAAAMIASAARGMDPALPLRSVAAAWYGVEAYIAGGEALALGLATHLAVAAAWGALFGTLARPASRLGALLDGLAFGAAVWLVMTLAVAPVFDPALSHRASWAPRLWAALHLVYGALLPLSPPLRRRLRRRAVVRAARAVGRTVSSG